MGNLSDSPEAAAYRDLLKKLLEFHDTDAGNAECFELLHGEEFRQRLHSRQMANVERKLLGDR